MSDWADALLMLAGVGLGGLLVFACVVFLLVRLLWNLFGHDAAVMLSDAWRGRLSKSLDVAPPPLPAMERPEAFVRPEDRPS